MASNCSRSIVKQTPQWASWQVCRLCTAWSEGRAPGVKARALTYTHQVSRMPHAQPTPNPHTACHPGTLTCTAPNLIGLP
eukprot:10778167-Alexandrium_andersonii.AAC.1